MIPTTALFHQRVFDYKVPLSAAELMVLAAAAYYQVSREELLCITLKSEQVRRKYMLYYLLKTHVQITSPVIATLCGTSRQNVNQACDRMEGEVNIYLQSASDYRKIRELFENLQKAQHECLTSHKTSMTPSIGP